METIEALKRKLAEQITAASDLASLKLALTAILSFDSAVSASAETAKNKTGSARSEPAALDLSQEASAVPNQEKTGSTRSEPAALDSRQETNAMPNQKKTGLTRREPAALDSR